MAGELPDRSVLVTDTGLRASRFVAQAALELGVLDRYVTSFIWNTPGHPFWSRVIPSALGRVELERLLGRRVFDGVPKERVQRILLPEVVGRGVGSLAKRTHLGPDGAGFHLRETMFDWLASRCMKKWTRVVYANEGSGLRTLRIARRRGITTILEGTFDPDFECEVLTAAYHQLGLPYDAATWAIPRRRRELALADLVVTQSEVAAQSFLGQGMARERLRVVPLGVDPSVFGAPAGGHNSFDMAGPLRLLFVGTVGVRKGVPVLLEALRALPTRAVELVLIGQVEKAYEPQFRASCNGLQCRTTHIAGMSRSELGAYYRWAHYLVLPSLLDSFGQVVVEAMACATPVVVSDACGIPVRDGVDGWVVTAGHVESLVDLLIRLAENPTGLAARLSPAALDTARHMTWVSFRERMKVIIREAV